MDKQLPWGAGLGGGSSDAASTLLALNRLWGLHWPRERLLELGATLGADVPFFIGGHNAFVEGIGERLTPLALPPQRYRAGQAGRGHRHGGHLRQPGAGPRHRALLYSRALLRVPGNLPSFAAGSAATTCSRWPRRTVPRSRSVAEWLQGRFGNSRMTGSGSAVFARVGMEDQSLAAWPAQPLPGPWIVRMCRSLDHHPLAGLGRLRTGSRGRGASRVLRRGVAKLVKASDFDSDMRGFESFLPCQTSSPTAGH